MLNEEHKVSNKKEQARLRAEGHQIQEHATRINGLLIPFFVRYFTCINNILCCS